MLNLSLTSFLAWIKWPWNVRFSCGKYWVMPVTFLHFLSLNHTPRRAMDVTVACVPVQMSMPNNQRRRKVLSNKALEGQVHCPQTIACPSNAWSSPSLPLPLQTHWPLLLKITDLYFFTKEIDGLFGIDVTDLVKSTGNGCVHHSLRCIFSFWKYIKVMGITQYMYFQTKIWHSSHFYMFSMKFNINLTYIT